MAGTLLVSGQSWILDVLASGLQDNEDGGPSGVWVGLMTNAAVSEAYDLPTDIEEVSGSGYSRQICSSWSKTAGVDPYITGSEVTFSPSGTWADVRGYFVALTSGNYDALWAEVFPSSKWGDKLSGDTIKITPKYEQKDDNE